MDIDGCCMKNDSVSELARKRTATPRIRVRVPSLSLQNLEKLWYMVITIG